MGKRIIARARGRGGMQYRSPGHRYVGRVSYLSMKEAEQMGKGTVKDIIHDPARSAPVAILHFDGLKKDVIQIAPEGLQVKSSVEYGEASETGNVLKLIHVPLGTRIFGIEASPNSGPKLCRSAGSFATVENKTDTKVSVKFSSGKMKEFSGECRATVGVPAGGGRLEKPWIKAGKRHHAMRARGKLYPITSGVAMSAVDHPYGGRRHAPRPSGTTSRNAPPGRKVGSVAARRMGKRKGRKSKN